uniref:BRD4-interacting chromatin-remodeling complex-associated protein-like n=1 Tax=Styela clava TaxID=7725 RepID=UPI0019399E1F|nr:BRD4-interacting chromatin-remodeling complex-associated protein-like [Styela clava]
MLVSEKKEKEREMDILQQSLQAADILSGEDNDIFGELGITFNNSSVETVGLGDDLSALDSQGNALFNNETKAHDQSPFPSFNESNDSNSMSGFDTSQFLNTSAPINSAQSARHTSYEQQPTEFAKQENYQHLPVSLHSNQPSSSATTVSPFANQHEGMTNYANQYQTVQQVSMQSVSQPSTTVATYQPYSKAISTVASSPVLTRLPSQTLSTLLNPQPSTLSADNSPATLPVGIRIATPNTFQNDTNIVLDNNTHVTQNANVLRTSTPIQILQPTAVQQNQTQLITVLQKQNNIRVSSPVNQNVASAQYINGLTVQPHQTNVVNQNSNVAVLRVASSKQNINISDPQLVKALTANLLQKQQTSEMQNTQQPPQQQFVKLDHNNSVINVISQRPQPQVRGAQQITLQNGQTILLNSSQHVQVLQAPTPAQNVASSLPNYPKSIKNSLQPSKSGQMPIKGIQIASVNIPIASPSANTTSVDVAPTANSILAIPVVAKPGSISSTVTSASFETGATVAVSRITPSVATTLKSSTVRNLLTNSILKQNNNTSLTNSNISQPIMQQHQSTSNAQVVMTETNGQVARASMGPTLRLNLTPQQASKLTTSQLQTIIKQHRATLQARALANADSRIPTAVDGGQAMDTSSSSQATIVKNTLAGSKSLASILKPSVTAAVTTVASNSSVTVSRQGGVDQQSSVQAFRVDPTLTEGQIDEVKKLLTNRTIASKLHQLSREQRQLVLAFQAQIKSMSPPVQQYYLRNPQLFMQKVLQQIRAGKPFILNVKVDVQQNKVQVVPTNQSSNVQHPTISLTQDQPRSTRLAAPSPTRITPVKPSQASSKFSPISLNQVATTAANITVQMPKKAIKRPAPATSKVSLVLEQLECHKKMTTNPDCVHPFKSVRDAIRRLVPFHTCNIPNVKEEHFEESEKIFDKIADRIVARTRAMVNKYHLLSLRDSTRDSCSAEMVMIERMFLQKEKAKLAEDKAKLKENPSLIKEYFPRRSSEEANTTDIDDNLDTGTAGTSPQNCLQLDTYLKNETDSSGFDQEVSSSPHFYKTVPESSASDSECRSNFNNRLISYESTSSPGDSKRIRVDVSDAGSQSSSEETLLLEAVDSILLP